MQEILNKKILVVDDEPELLQLIENALLDDGFFAVYTASDAKSAEKVSSSQQIALFILDVNLPDMNGFMLYKHLRQHSAAPVIFLTARADASDRLRGLGLGADDYITKPFLLKELVLRVRAVLRRTYGTKTEDTGFTVGEKRVDFERASVISPDGKEDMLTAKELILIKKLWENKGRIVTNDALCMAAWGEDYYGHENSLMVHIRRLRKKTEPNPSKPRYIITAKGLGYRLEGAE